MTTIDTAEMYGDGRSETLIGKAIKGMDRQEIQLISKALPSHADPKSLRHAVEKSLSRLGSEYLDIYLLHWRGNIPLQETVEGMEALVDSGLILQWGVSNFDVEDMEELFSISGGEKAVCNQVLYNLGSRGIEFDLLPWCESNNVVILAYCPLAQAGALKRMNIQYENVPVLQEIAQARQTGIYEILLAFANRFPGVIPIPKAARSLHVRNNAKASEIVLTQEELSRLDLVFYPPKSKMHLDIE
jgi:diketogulonate reductase-like aldo/keto reductase